MTSKGNSTHFERALTALSKCKHIKDVSKEIGFPLPDTRILYAHPRLCRSDRFVFHIHIFLTTMEKIQHEQYDCLEEGIAQAHERLVFLFFQSVTHQRSFWPVWAPHALTLTLVELPANKCNQRLYGMICWSFQNGKTIVSCPSDLCPSTTSEAEQSLRF